MACPIDPGSDIELQSEDLREFRIDQERLLSLVGEAQRVFPARSNRSRRVYGGSGR